MLPIYICTQPLRIDCGAQMNFPTRVDEYGAVDRSAYLEEQHKFLQWMNAMGAAQDARNVAYRAGNTVAEAEWTRLRRDLFVERREYERVLTRKSIFINFLFA